MMLTYAARVLAAGRAAHVILIFLCIAATPAVAASQPAAVIYLAEELDDLPAFASPHSAAKTMTDSYPASMRRLGITGLVQVQFVVSATGRVEPGSVEVLSSTAPVLSTAALQALPSIQFTPGKVDGRAVRARVLLPIIYK